MEDMTREEKLDFNIEIGVTHNEAGFETTGTDRTTGREKAKCQKKSW